MITQTKVKAGATTWNHNQEVVRQKKLVLENVRRKKGGVRSGVKAGRASYDKVKPVPAN
jgi:hypothetical protein